MALILFSFSNPVDCFILVENSNLDLLSPHLPPAPLSLMVRSLCPDKSHWKTKPKILWVLDPSFLFCLDSSTHSFKVLSTLQSTGQLLRSSNSKPPLISLHAVSTAMLSGPAAWAWDICSHPGPRLQHGVHLLEGSALTILKLEQKA